MGKLVVLAAMVTVMWTCQTAPSRSAAPAAAVDPQVAVHAIATASVEATVNRLGHDDGFYLTPAYHIALPDSLGPPVKVLNKNFMPTLAVDLEKAINHTAEIAAGAAGDILEKAIPTIVFSDPAHILAAAPDGVTAAIKASTVGKSLRSTLLPIVHDKLANSGAAAALAEMRARYENLENAPFPQFDLDSYAVDSLLSAFFASVAESEMEIRSRPSARTSDTLKRIFAN